MRLAKTAVWSFTDQGLSSLSNFGALIFAAHVLNPASFGSYSLAISAYGFATGLCYALAGEPFQVRFSHAPNSRKLRSAGHSALGTALAISLLGLSILVITSFAVTQPVRGAFLAMGFALPGLLVQDTVRQVYFAQGRPNWASCNDGIWILSASAVGLVFAHFSGFHSPAAVIFVYSSGAWIAAIFGCGHLRLWPNFGRAVQWLSAHRDIWPSFSLDYVAMSGATLIVIYLLPFIVGVPAVGALRAAQVLYGPLTIFTTGSRVFGIPEGVKRLADGIDPFRRLAFVYTGLMSLLAVAYSVGILLIPADLGRRIIGSTWPLAAPLLIYVALSNLGVALGTGPFQGLRVLGDGRRILRARSLDAPTTVSLGVLGAVLFGLKGAAAGMGIANMLVTGMWGYQFIRACADAKRSPRDVPIESSSTPTERVGYRLGPESPEEVALRYLRDYGEFHLSKVYPNRGIRDIRWRASVRSVVIGSLGLFVAASAGVVAWRLQDTPRGGATSSVGSPSAHVSTNERTHECPNNSDQAVNELQFAAPSRVIHRGLGYVATVLTTMGTFRIELTNVDDPDAVNSFIFLAEKGFYRCNTFFRAVPNGFVISGDPTGTGLGGPGYLLPLIPPPKVAPGSIQFLPGTVGLIPAAGEFPNVGSQWCIVTGPKGERLPDLFTELGHVTSGLGVLQQISEQWHSGKPAVLPRVLRVAITSKRS